MRARPSDSTELQAGTRLSCHSLARPGFSIRLADLLTVAFLASPSIVPETVVLLNGRVAGLRNDDAGRKAVQFERFTDHPVGVEVAGNERGALRPGT